MKKIKTAKLISVFLTAAFIAAALFIGSCGESISGAFESVEGAPQDVENPYVSFIGDGTTIPDINELEAVVHWDLPANSASYSGVWIKFDTLDGAGNPLGEPEKRRITDLNVRTENFDLPVNYNLTEDSCEVTIWAVNVLGELSKGVYGKSKYSNATYCTLTYDPNGGTGVAWSQYIPVNVPHTVSGANDFTKTGYTFAGWNTSVDGDGNPTVTYYGAGDKIQLTDTAKTTTLYALWANGTEDAPYPIWRQDNLPGGLEYITTSGLDQNYKIVQDFTITPPYTAPISFKGILDGNGKTITWNAGTTLLTPSNSKNQPIAAPSVVGIRLSVVGIDPKARK